MRNLHIKDKWSDISMNEYAMEYAGVSSFSNYIEEVVMTGNAFNSRVDMKSISYFAPSLGQNEIRDKPQEC